MTPVKRFISHYMFVEPICEDEKFCRWSAEEMRSNKGVWITEYFAVDNDKKRELLHIASEIKRLSHPVTVRVLDVFSEDNSFFIVTEIPKSKLLVPMDRFDTDRFRLIGGNLLKAFVILQRNGIGLEALSLNDIFVDENRDIQLMITKEWVIKSEKESREKEIDLFAIVLLNYLGFKDEEKVEITQEFLKKSVPEKIYPLFEEILIDRKVQRFESLSRYFQEKMKITADSVMDTDGTEHHVSNRFTRLVMLGLITVMIYAVFVPINNVSQSSRFDFWKYRMLGSIGMSEPQRILGEIYEKGYGVEKDMKASIEWYRKAAQSGNVYAQMSLGHLYDQGIGVAIDKKQALYWFTLAATNGDEVAKENVALLSESSKKESDKKVIDKKEEEIADGIPTAEKPLSEPSKELVSVAVIENNSKYKEINYNQFHTYWVHSINGTDPDGVQRYRGAIFGCGQEGFNNPVEIVSLDHDVRSIVVDENRNIYWTDITTGEILKADPNGHNIRAIVKGLMYPITLAIDNKNKKLYWNDWQNKLKQQKGYIGRSNLNGEGAEIIVTSGLRSGGTIRIDEREGKIYVADLFGKKIVRINLDGTNMVPIAFSEQPAGLDIDYDHRRIYWSDLSKDGIYTSDYDGRNQQRLYTNGDGFSNPEALVYDHTRQKIFFAQNINFQDNIFSIDINGNNLRNEYAQQHLYIRAIVQP